MFYIQKMPGWVTLLCVKQMFFLQIIASFQHKANFTLARKFETSTLLQILLLPFVIYSIILLEKYAHIITFSWFPHKLLRGIKSLIALKFVLTNFQRIRYKP